ncbi:stage II sporulation protein M [Candidatus Bathyarchaeota archaeon]|nr:stage II sporulation protein M [Candidatus Bathyarchaeota archaeon]
MLFLRLKSLFLKSLETIKSAIQRNGLIVKATTTAFFIALLVTVIVTVFVFSLAPELSDNLSSLAQSVFNFEDAPDPFTGSFFSYIFLNNIGHLWNPVRMLVWVPLLGSALLGFEILLNGGLIGAVAVIVGVEQGIAYPIVGLLPHGIIEIPAFLLQTTCIVVWQVTVSEAIIAKLRGRKVEKDKTRQGLQDALILAVASIILFMIAAVIETYITPYILGI